MCVGTRFFLSPVTLHIFTSSQIIVLTCDFYLLPFFFQTFHLTELHTELGKYVTTPMTCLLFHYEEGPFKLIPYMTYSLCLNLPHLPFCCRLTRNVT